jgi:PAS domain S-box-containing protein
MKPKVHRNDKLKVLCLEDEPRDAEIIHELLIDAGYDLSMDITAIEKDFVSFLRGSTYDIILSDFKLPGFDGFTALRWAMEICPTVPFICVSGKIGEEAAVELLKMGAVDYVLKDRLERLPFAVQRALDETKEKEARRKAEEALRLALVKYKTLFDCFPLGITVSDEMGNILETNPTAEKMLSLQQDEQIQRDIDSPEWRIVRPDGSPMPPDEYASVRALKQKSKVENVEMGIVKPDNTITWINVTAAPLPLEGHGVVITYNDITERKRAEETLRISDLRFRELFNHMSNGVVVYEAIDNGRDFIFRDFNPAAEKIEKVSRKDTLGKRVTEVFPGVKAFGVFEVFQRVWQTGKPEFFPANIYKDEKGLESWRESWVLKLPSGEIVAIYNDITERKRAEEALKKSAQLLRDTGEMAQVGGWELDLSTKVVLMTDEVCRIHGVAPGFQPKMEEAINFYAPESRLEVEAVVKKAAETGEPYDLESLFIPRGSKDKIWVRSVGKPVYSGGKIVKLVGAFQNIDKYKKAEEALRKNEEKYRGIFENIQDVYYEAAIEGTIHEVSPSIEIMSKGQYHRDDLIGKSMWDFYDDSGERKTLLNMLRERGKVIDFEITLKNRDGSLIPCSISSKIQLNDRGGPEKIIGSMRDITERKRAEEQIRKDLREKEVMLKEIHHRVRNNLNVITSLLSLQSDHITTKRQALAALEESTNRIYSMALVHSNLYKEGDYSRVDLTSITKNLTQNLSQVYKTDVEIEVQIENSSLDLNNAVPCGLILNELVTNAMKHAFKDKRKGLIKIEFRMLKDNTYELTVQDNGIGLPKEINVSQSKSLGLLIVNQLISQIDGVLKITRGKGTRFQITFPVSAT